jgi:hypothetical protein
MQMFDAIKPVEKIGWDNGKANHNVVDQIDVRAQLIRNHPSRLVVTMWTADADKEMNRSATHKGRSRSR